MGSVSARAYFAIKSFLPCDVTYAISEPKPSAILSHGGERSRIKFAQAEGLGTRLAFPRVEGLGTRLTETKPARSPPFCSRCNVSYTYPFHVRKASAILVPRKQPTTLASPVQAVVYQLRRELICTLVLFITIVGLVY